MAICRRRQRMIPSDQEPKHLKRGTTAAGGQGEQVFAGRIYIGQDGIERVASDLPALIARIQDRSLTESSLVKGSQSEAWRRAEADPNLAPIFNLVVAKKTGKCALRWALILLKSAFLVTMFSISTVAAIVVAQLNSEALTQLMGYKVAVRLSFPTLFAVFAPAVLAVRDRRFTFGTKAARFGLSIVTAAAIIDLPGLFLAVIFVILPLRGWPALGLTAVVGVGVWVLLAFTLMRIWGLSTVVDVLRAFPFVKLRRSPSGAPPDKPPSGEDEIWRAFLEHDEAVRQAVGRLTALSPANVQEFRQLLLASGDRSRIPEYEDESIFRTQGPAFVGNETLQRVYVLLNSKDRSSAKSSYE
jgi:hypothetical protein